MKKSSIVTASEFFERVWENGDLDAIFTMFDGRADGLTQSSLDPEGYLRFYQGVTAFLKDFQVEITDWMSQGDKLFLRWQARARHRTKDKVIHWPGTSFGTYRDGKILEAHNYFDFMNLFQQLEIVPEQAVSRGLAGEEFLALPTAGPQPSRTLWQVSESEPVLPTRDELAEVFGHCLSGLVSCDGEGCVCDGNNRFAELLGMERAELRGRSFRDWLPPDEWVLDQSALHELMEGIRACDQRDVTLLSRHGPLPVKMRTFVLRPKAAPIVILRAVEPSSAPDLSRLHELERRLLHSELHDGLAQDLATLWVTLQASSETEAISPALFQRCARLIQAMSREVSSTMHLLRNGWLMEEGTLDESVASLQARYLASDSLDIRWEITGNLASVQGLPAHFAYRVLQEGLRNVQKHAQTRYARVTVRVDDPRVYLIIEDRGRGFAQTSGGSGLAGIEHRCRLSGGEFRITSVPGQGTRLECQLPCEWTLATAGE
ncbi:MAG: ester cyclase [Candidatus Eremiobacteraeota bacterium]|nr:ester cyclase [Candidatus Eremiobacteraeota bacterium]MCW5865925.1 ester cyclase [Candidatus Eremiobacteraeota bacterium]